MQLYLVRHTRLAIADGICYGQSDVPVAASFDQDWPPVAAKLAVIQADAHYSSPLQRCTQLAKQLQLSNLHLDARLMELQFGDWELQAWEAIDREALDTWSADYVQHGPPNGESFMALYQRVGECLTQLQTQHRNQTVIVITHAGVIRAMLAQLLSLPLTEVFKFQLDYGSVSLLNFNDAYSSIGYLNR